MTVNVNLRHLRYLVTLSESSTFAARGQGSSHHPIDLKVPRFRDLRPSSGHPLIDRSGRRMQLLPFGEAMVRRARHILAEIQELPEYAAQGNLGH